MDVSRVAQAEADVRAARARLTVTTGKLQNRLSPTTLVREARREIVDIGSAARSAAADRPRRALMSGSVALLIVAALPLIRWRKRGRTLARAARIRGN